MQIHLYSNLESYLERTQSFLLLEPAIHSFILSLSRRYLEVGKPMSLLATISDSDNSVIATGIQTESDRPMIVSQTSNREAESFAQVLASQVEHLPGVNGPTPAVDAFANTWVSIKNNQAKLFKNLRLFELDAVIEPPQPSGSARQAHASDRDIILSWIRNFYTEATPHDPKPSDEDLLKNIDSGIRLQHFFVWENENEVVSLVGSRRETETEKWIAPVYTPHEHRGRGYGSALTAYVSQRIVSSGKRGMLFTDLANPISNSIYQKMGYKPITDFKHIGFMDL